MNKAKFIRSAKLLEIKQGADRLVDDLQELIAYDLTDEAVTLFNNFIHEVAYMTVFEPALRYWLNSDGNIVWASTRNELEFHDNEFPLKEISMEDYQELRRKEWAQLNPTKLTEETPNASKEKNSESIHSCDCNCDKCRGHFI
jgi:hypothetical protein